MLGPSRQLWFVYSRIGFSSLAMTWVKAKKVFCSTMLPVKSHPAPCFPVTNHLGNSICLCLETEVAVAHCEQFSINFLDKISQIYTELMGTVRAGLFQEKTNVLIPLIGLSQFHSQMPLGSSSARTYNLFNCTLFLLGNVGEIHY